MWFEDQYRTRYNTDNLISVRKSGACVYAKDVTGHDNKLFEAANSWEAIDHFEWLIKLLDDN